MPITLVLILQRCFDTERFTNQHIDMTNAFLYRFSKKLCYESNRNHLICFVLRAKHRDTLQQPLDLEPFLRPARA